MAGFRQAEQAVCSAYCLPGEQLKRTEMVLENVFPAPSELPDYKVQGLVMPTAAQR